jgi:aspartyl protease family protein
MAWTSGNKQLLREAISWGVVAVVAVAAISHFETLKTGAEQMLGLPTASEVAEARRTVRTPPATKPVNRDSVVEIEAERNGHFNIEADINGRSIPVMIDTGATMVVLS